jgi:uncharacterized protein (DUF1499 family)
VSGYKLDNLALCEFEDDGSQVHLRPVPNSPCGVSSQSNAPQSRISAIRPHGEKSEEIKRIAEIISTLPGYKVASLQKDYLHAILKRGFFFVDDLEILWSESENVFHIRSVARSGITDFGANRTRVDSVRLQFDKGYQY